MQRSKGKWETENREQTKPKQQPDQAKQKTTPETPQPSKIPLLQVKQVKRVRRNPHWIGKKLVNEELVRGKLRLPTTEHGKKTMDSNTIATDGQDPVNDQANRKQKQHQQQKQTKPNKPKTTTEPEPAHQRGETKSEVRRAPD